MPAEPLTASEIAAAVRAGHRSAAALRAEALARARSVGEPARGPQDTTHRDAATAPLNAFTHLFDADSADDPDTAADPGAAAARMLDRATSEDLATLPLAGVPLAIKSNVTVESHSIRRLLHAGAVPIGYTTTPEFCVWGDTDSPEFGITRNPWNRRLNAGGSSGGSAAAVAAGIVPIAHGNDGMGSLRIPAACCGLVTLKPGPGVVPTELGAHNWGGMAEDGIIATTVADLSLATAAMAARDSLATRRDPGPLRIALALNCPVTVAGRPLVHLHPAIAKALAATAQVLRSAGHVVVESPIPYPTSPFGLLARWTGGLDADAAEANFPISRMERRNRYHALVGRLLRGLDTYAAQRATADAMHAYIDARGDGRDGNSCDLVMTPTLAGPPLAAEAWYERSWARVLWANMRYAPYPALFNHIAWPAMSLPAGDARLAGAPIGVQLAARPGDEALLLDVAAQLERLQPWTRTAPAPGA